ncbi:MAG: cupredoxin domain-containing protein [Actinomycetota bacterium]|nr:cupredoxin domain-containing protein [Actinomycetota bacterium]
MRTLRSLLVLVMFCAGVIACSSSNAPAACTPSGPTQMVDLKDFAFEPTCIGVSSGATLALQNTGSALHTFTVTGTAIDQKLDGGADGEASLAGIAPGTYAVVCTLHPQMTATLQVT